MSEGKTATPPEYNVTGHDYGQREHLAYAGPPIMDIHAHVTMTKPDDQTQGPAGGGGAAGSSIQAEQMLAVAEEFGIGRTYSMCPVQDIRPLRDALGATRIGFNGMIGKRLDEPDEAAQRNLEAFLEAGIEIVKLWAAPRGRDRGYTLDASWRIACLKQARAAGIRVVMCHVADPDRWWAAGKPYEDPSVYGTKAEQYLPLRRMLELFSDMTWIAAHMGGDPEHPDHLEQLLTTYPHLHIDTSATKWQVREVSPRTEAIRQLIECYPDRFLFGSDLVTRHHLAREHYVSRYWCQRTLWESNWQGPSPIRDPDHLGDNGEATPRLRGVGLSPAVVTKVYLENARRILRLDG